MEEKIKKLLLQNSLSIFGVEIDENNIQFQKTRKDVKGDLTLVVFPFVKILKDNPTVVGQKIGDFLKENSTEIDDFEVISGFLNISFTKEYWKKQLLSISKTEKFGFAQQPSNELYMVEYSSPNTNKPLHLGHLRNIFLGYSVANILEANGHEVIKTQIVNDRGIHICKSMVAWQQFAKKEADGTLETPHSSGMKGDHFVGKYYIEFDKQVNLQGLAIAKEWKHQNFEVETLSLEEREKLKTLFNALENVENVKDKSKIERKIAAFGMPFAQLTVDAKEMLVRWEANDAKAIDLWSTMNGWVYEGFDETYHRLHVDFDKIYYESETFILGKDIVEEGVDKNLFFKKEDNSVWVDLTNEGLDEKLLLRGDGTAVYMTQDIGTAILRYKDYPKLNGTIYTVGDEQNYHFKVLFLILDKLGYSWAKKCYHLSYGMVDLPDGKMKSREGRVIDADDLIDEVIEKATISTRERGQIDGMSEEEKDKLYEIIGLGGLKYFLLKVDPQKRMKFNPEESIDLNGNTGPFIQYAYARINSLLGKVEMEGGEIELTDAEIGLIKELSEFPSIIKEAGVNYSPALIANYIYELVKNYNSFYQLNSVLREENSKIKNARILVSQITGNVIKTSMRLMGIEVPNRM